MTIDQLLWDTSRVAALTAFFMVSASLLSGQALRSALLGTALRNRELLTLHRFLTVCWIPLVVVHVVAMTLDSVARISPLDLVIPFRVSYAPIPVGLGTVGLEILVVVVVTSYLRGHLGADAWRRLHRLAYVMFGVFVAHALLSGTDFTRAVVLTPAAALVVFIAVLSLARMAFGRLDEARG